MIKMIRKSPQQLGFVASGFRNPEPLEYSNQIVESGEPAAWKHQNQCKFRNNENLNPLNVFPATAEYTPIGNFDRHASLMAPQKQRDTSACQTSEPVKIKKELFKGRNIGPISEEVRCQLYGFRAALRRGQMHETNESVAVKQENLINSPPREKGMRSVEEIPEKAQILFPDFKWFNRVQSEVLDDIFYTDRSIVVAAPTGSGKTGIFELAMARVLFQTDGSDTSHSWKIVYIAPVKALCSERVKDWKRKLSEAEVNVLELTGDQMGEDIQGIERSNVIVSTPEKWDAVSRRLKDKKSIFGSIKLFLIDEVHLINDEDRGHVLEAIVSRLKISLCRARFVAVSATIPNVEDIAAWIGGEDAIFFNFTENYRPVKLNRVVIGYPFYEGQSEFRFEMNLSYRLGRIIGEYGGYKPTLVFCNSRKSTLQTASILSKEIRARFSKDSRPKVLSIAGNITDAKLRNLVIDFGIGFHHAGLNYGDRQAIETLFSENHLAVLTCTSTLALGVNLPAELVVVKSTQQMCKGGWKEYSESQVLQMAGRAGRPQFCDRATVVIMTEESKKRFYERLIDGTQLMESSLQKHLHQHLNAEIIFGTIKTVEEAVSWLKSSFLFVRMKKNPARYSVVRNSAEDGLNDALYQMCTQALNDLARVELITLCNDGQEIIGTSSGRLMSRYYLAFETMDNFSSLEGNESILQILVKISECKEFSETVLRVGEKKVLNNLNSGKEAKVRFPLEGKVKTAAMKVNLLIQAMLGARNICDPGMSLEAPRLFQLAGRISSCLVEFVLNSRKLEKCFHLVENILILNKSLSAGIWENSPHVAKQMDRIGIVISNHLVAAGYSSFDAISSSNPRDLEVACGKCPPFGNSVRNFALSMPKYRLTVEQNFKGPDRDTVELEIRLIITNRDDYNSSSGNHDGWNLLVGSEGLLLHRIKGRNSFLLDPNRPWKRYIMVQCRDCPTGSVDVTLIHDTLSGVDVKDKLKIFFSPSTPTLYASSQRPNYCGEAPEEWFEHQARAQFQRVENAYRNEAQVGTHFSTHQLEFPTDPGIRGQVLDLPEEWYEHQASTQRKHKQPQMSRNQLTDRCTARSVEQEDNLNLVRMCQHSCKNKMICAHQCCKTGIKGHVKRSDSRMRGCPYPRSSIAGNKFYMFESRQRNMIQRSGRSIDEDISPCANRLNLWLNQNFARKETWTSSTSKDSLDELTNLYGNQRGNNDVRTPSINQDRCDEVRGQVFTEAILNSGYGRNDNLN